MTAPERGDFIFIQFDSQAGREQQGFRPGILIVLKSKYEVESYLKKCNIAE